jgi:murein DD-endopeptidase MepM/ murein hydrolase activator NlpD
MNRHNLTFSLLISLTILLIVEVFSETAITDSVKAFSSTPRPTNQVSFDLTPQPTPTINGRYSVNGVINSGNANDRVGVDIYFDNSLMGSSNTNGQFFIHNLPPGEHVIEPRKEGLYFSPPNVTIMFEGGHCCFQASFSVQNPGYKVSGRITTDTDQPQSGIQVKLNNEATVNTNELGEFVFINVQAGQYTITPLGTTQFIYSPATHTINVEADVNGVTFFQRPFPKPFLDKPIFSDKAFPDLIKPAGRGGALTSWFDHRLPVSDTDDRVWLWNGDVLEGNTSPQGCNTGVNCYDQHSGTDLDDLGGYVNALAAADGVVHIVHSTDNGGYGKYVVIDHLNGYASLYGHLESIAQDVASGKPILKQAVVGTIGNSGFSTSCSTPRCGTHLHFGVYFDRNGDRQWKFEEEVVDPFGWCSRYRYCTTDPWEVQSGMVSYYLWNYPLYTELKLNSDGGTLQDPSSNIVVTVPSNAVSNTVTLDLLESPFNTFLAQLEEGYRFIYPSFSLQVLEWLLPDIQSASLHDQKLNQLVNISIRHEAVAHFNPASFRVAYFDENTNLWQFYDTTRLNEATVQISTDKLGKYSLVSQLVCPVESSEPNDVDVSAVSLSVGQASDIHVFDSISDVDWFAIELEAGQRYHVMINGSVNAITTFIDSDGKTVLSDSGEFVPTSSGIYFVKIGSKAGENVSCDGTYQVLVGEDMQQQVNSIFMPLIQRQ